MRRVGEGQKAQEVGDRDRSRPVLLSVRLLFKPGVDAASVGVGEGFRGEVQREPAKPVSV